MLVFGFPGSNPTVQIIQSRGFLKDCLVGEMVWVKYGVGILSGTMVLKIAILEPLLGHFWRYFLILIRFIFKI